MAIIHHLLGRNMVNPRAIGSIEVGVANGD